MQEISVFRVWKLECDTCSLTCSPLAWSYELPKTCQCGGILLIVGNGIAGKDTKEPLGPSNRVGFRDWIDDLPKRSTNRDLIESEINAEVKS